MESFSGILGEIEEVAGREAAVTLSVMYGGRRLYVPKQVTAGGWLSRELGDAAARALATRFGGTYVDVPIAPGVRAQIRMLRSAGYAIREIAAAVRRTERYVYLVLASSPDNHDPRQTNLFG